MTKIVVHGAGSIGCFIGGAWAHAGLDVTLIGRDYVRKTINENGVMLTDYSGFNVKLPAQDIAFSESATALQDADIIILAVKSTGTENAAKEIAANAKDGAAVVSLQNGISNVDILKRILPKQIIIAGMVPYNVANLGKGHWHKGTQGIIMAENNAVLEPIVAATNGGPAALKLKDNMPAIAWGKLLINLNNAINALSGETLLNELSQRDYRRVFSATITEGIGVLKAANITPAQIGPMPPQKLAKILKAPNFLFNYVFLRLQKIDARARSSMAEDFDAGRKTEIDYLNGEIIALANKHGISAPYSRAIVELVRDAENGGRKTWSARELRQRVLGR